MYFLLNVKFGENCSHILFTREYRIAMIVILNEADVDLRSTINQEYLDTHRDSAIIY